MQRDRTAVWLAYAGMCAIWGTTWLVIKVALHYAPPITGVGLRFVVAGLFLYAIAFARREVPPLRELPWKVLIVFALTLFGVNYVLTYTAETHLDSGLVAVLFGTLPFFVFGFGHSLVGERTTARIWIGAVCAFAGVGVISLSPQVQASPLYALVAIAAAGSAAFGNVYAKRHSGHAPLVTLPPSMLLSGVVMLAFGLVVERTDWHAVVSLPSLGAIAYLAILGSGIAFFLNMWVLHRIEAWIVGLSALIIPVIAVVVGVTLGGEHFTTREILGSALVVAGIWIALTQRETAAEVAS